MNTMMSFQKRTKTESLTELVDSVRFFKNQPDTKFSRKVQKYFEQQSDYLKT